MNQKGVPEPQAALDRVKIIENGEPLVDLRSIPLLSFRNEAKHTVTPYLRKSVAEMLAKAAERIPKEFTLHVISALRPIEEQKRIWQYHYDYNKSEHPDWPENVLRRAVNKYVAPFDHPAPPGHSTGAAVDVVLRRHNGSFVDVVPPDMKDWSIGHTWTNKLDPETKRLRMMLVGTMLAVGFSNCRDEYWHYSWGDSGWAVRVGKKECCYGVAPLLPG